VAVASLAGYRLVAEPVDDGLLAIAPAVREADGGEVTVRIVVAELTKVQVRRLRNEAAELDRMLAENNNPYVLSLRDHDRDASGRPFLVTDRRGRSLGDEMAERGPLPTAEALAAVHEAAAGLERLHRAGMSHGAISPATLLRRPTGRVVLDCPSPAMVLELATAMGDGTGHEPPEVLAGADWTPRGEIYALASTLCTLLTGQSPLPADRATRWRADQGDPRPARLPGAASGLRATLERALASDPDARPATMAEFVRGLRTKEGDGVPEAFPHESPAGELRTTDAGASTGRDFGDYVLLSQIGSGSSGTVWRGRRRADGLPVAVKVLHPHLVADPDTLMRLVREGQVPLRHPNVVQVLDTYLAAGKGEAGVVMELVDGSTLQKLLRDRDLGRAEGTRLLAEVAAGLAAAHTSNMVHRDVKPENILVRVTDGRRHALLTDFGLVKALGGPTVTQVGQVPGTPAYLAPELVRGEAPTPASDVYSLGVTAYEVLAGQRPFVGSTMQVLWQHRDLQPRRPPGIPDHAWSFLAACLAKDPRRRPTADDAAVTLEDLTRDIALSGPETLGHADDEADSPNGADTVVIDPVRRGASAPIASPPADSSHADAAGATRTSADALRPPPVPATGTTRPRLRRWIALAGGVVLLAAVGNGIGILIAKSGDGGEPEQVRPTKKYVPLKVVLNESGDVPELSWKAAIENGPELKGLKGFGVFDGEGHVMQRPANEFTYTITDPEPGACYNVSAIVETTEPVEDRKPFKVCLKKG
jgi:serine/threonine protein kinase